MCKPNACRPIYLSLLLLSLDRPLELVAAISYPGSFGLMSVRESELCLLIPLEVDCVLRTRFGITVFSHRGLPACGSLPFRQADPRQAEFGDSMPSFGVSSLLASVSYTVQG